MTYELAFKESALKEWKRLGNTVREQFRKQLAERLDNPHVRSDALSGATKLYKIKLRQAGYRLVYSVEETSVTVTVIAVGKRDRNALYAIALSRQQDGHKR